MIGKVVRDALYIHREAVEVLDPDRRQRLDDALTLARNFEWNVVRFERHIVGFLMYQPFDAKAFPELLQSLRVDLDDRVASKRDYRRSANPLILHRKELLVMPSEVTEQWAKTTKKLEALGLFDDNHLIGRRRQWMKRLEAANIRVEGDVVIFP